MSGFPPSARLRAAREFTDVFAQGRRHSILLLSLHWLPSATPRLGLAVSRKVDPSAVGRNRIKRALREEFRALRTELRYADYVVVARTAAARATGAQLRQGLRELLRLSGALPPLVEIGTMPVRSSTPHH